MAKNDPGRNLGKYLHKKKAETYSDSKAPKKGKGTDTQDWMPTLNELSRTRIASGKDERPYQSPPDTKDKMPGVPIKKRKRTQV